MPATSKRKPAPPPTRRAPPSRPRTRPAAKCNTCGRPGPEGTPCAHCASAPALPSPPLVVLSRPRTPAELIEHRGAISAIVDGVMREGVHYGSPAPHAAGNFSRNRNLLKPGAELLALAFHLVPDYVATIAGRDNDHRDARVTCTLRDPMGLVVGQGIGSCSTLESRLMGDAIGPAEAWNVVLKMAKKRAFVDAVITATATSDLFTQDLDAAPAASAAQATAATSDTAKQAESEAKAEAGKLYCELKDIDAGAASFAWWATAPTYATRCDHLRAALAAVAALRLRLGDGLAFEVLADLAKRAGYEGGEHPKAPTKERAAEALRELLKPATPDATEQPPH